MSEWSVVPLGDVCELKRGYDLPNGSRRDGRIPVVSSSGPTGWHDEAKVSPPGVVTGRYGTLGQVFYIAEDFWPLNTALYVRDFKGNEPRFVAALLRSMNLAQYDGAAAVPGLNRNHLHTVPVRVPAVRTQGQIADVLQAFDDLIENNRRRIEVLEEMARAIYREWFVKFRYPGHGDVPMVDSALGLIPEGWQIAPTSTAIRVNPRIKLDKAEHPFIAMGDLDERSMGCRPSQVRSGGSGAKFERGDTLFARITPCLQNGKTGLVQSLADGEVGLGSTEFIVLRGQLVGSAFTYCLAREDAFRGHAIASMSGASGRQRVRNECFDTYLIAVPPQRLADTFETTMEPLFSQAAVLLDGAVRLEALRDVLLPKLVTGQIDVSKLNLDALILEQVA
ncbi:restriction endonuclease subunit S [Pseudarthrobacter sp. AB1]|uniref:restriction endonuclease subunit S n=1 Tax=Pseudarthrobacter sp. AB1 TaxID=2138309 RepID=UPI00186B9BC4|nr:restriction endonuclease subunit S [Pseudarthrobacter sp. AB1]MBE4720555.1 restriction endonuclease subunit S [Pseudarthrobacter sp. AB1]